MAVFAVAAVLVIALLLALPTKVVAAPRVSVISFTSSFLKGTSKMYLKMRPSQSGSAKMIVYDSSGRRVAVQNRPTITKGTVFSSTWAGRYTSSNELGKLTGSYAAAGTYKVVVTVKGKTGSAKVTRYVKVRTPVLPKLSSYSVTASITPSGTKGARAAQITYRTTVRYDAVMQVVSRSTGRIIAEQRYRDVTPNKTHTIHWDGLITRAGSATLPNGARADAGDVAPPGSYTVRITSRGARVTKTVKVLPTPVAAVKISSPSQTIGYEQSVQMSAAVSPRGAVDHSVTWQSSNAAIVAVDPDTGVAIAARKEGVVTIFAMSSQAPTVSGSFKLTVRSDSTLAIGGFSVPKFCVHGRSVALGGTVGSNYDIESVRIRITDTKTGTEIDKTVRAGTADFSGGKTLSIKSAIDRYIALGTLTPGEKQITVYAVDAMCQRTVYSQRFWVVGATAYQNFWQDRASTWVFPLDAKSGYTSPFGSIRDNGSRAHAAIDFIRPAGTPVYAMADGVVQRISVGTYFAGTGAVQVKHTDGSVIWYCEVLAAPGLKVGDAVRASQQIATVQRNTYGTAMLHLEAYVGNRTGNLYQLNSTTYDYVTPVPFNRRRDLISPMGVTLLPIPVSRGGSFQAAPAPAAAQEPQPASEPLVAAEPQLTPKPSINEEPQPTP